MSGFFGGIVWLIIWWYQVGGGGNKIGGVEKFRPIHPKIPTEIISIHHNYMGKNAYKGIQINNLNSFQK